MIPVLTADTLRTKTRGRAGLCVLYHLGHVLLGSRRAVRCAQRPLLERPVLRLRARHDKNKTRQKSAGPLRRSACFDPAADHRGLTRICYGWLANAVPKNAAAAHPRRDNIQRKRPPRASKRGREGSRARASSRGTLSRSNPPPSRCTVPCHFRWRARCAVCRWPSVRGGFVVRRSATAWDSQVITRGKDSGRFEYPNHSVRIL